MKCKQCEYPLWNIRGRNCPECGEAFLPSEFDFVLNSTRFCCPHCDQAYYGTGARGHLTPKTFDCANCGQHIDMDETVIRPADGVTERQTQVDVAPWIDRDRRWLGRFFGTVGWALTAPQRLAAGLLSSATAPWGVWFLIVTTLVSMIGAGSIGLIGVGFGAAMSARQGGTGPMLGVVGGCLGVLLGAVAVSVVFSLLWAAGAHGLLLVTGGLKTTGFKETVQAITFGSGANVISAVPCIGAYIGPFWWAISSTLMAKDLHRIGGGRAAFTTLTPPILAMVLLIGGYVALIAVAIGGVAGASALQNTLGNMQQARLMADAIVAWRQDHNGADPIHMLEIIQAPSSGVAPWDLTGMETDTTLVDIVVAGVGLDEWFDLRPTQQAGLARLAADELPPDVAAYRLGDYVFCYPGVPASTGSGVKLDGLWLAVYAPLPENMPAGTTATWCAAFEDGTQTIDPGQRATRLAAQNQRRADAGLAPLPSLETIRFAVRADGSLADDPAGAGGGSETGSEADSEADSGSESSAERDAVDGGEGG